MRERGERERVHAKSNGASQRALCNILLSKVPEHVYLFFGRITDTLSFFVFAFIQVSKNEIVYIVQNAVTKKLLETHTPCLKF